MMRDTVTSDSEKETAVRYLLGELAEEERDRFEKRFFQDDACFELLQAVEEELLDKYALNELPEAERARFEAGYVNSPRRRQKVELARAVAHYFLHAEEAPRLFSVAWLLPRVWVPLAAAATTAALVTVGWLWQDRQGLRNQIAQVRSKNQELAQGVQNEQRQRSLLEQQLIASNSHPVVASFVLDSGLARSDRAQGSDTRLEVRQGTLLLRIEVVVPGGGRVDRAAIENVEGQEIWSQSNLRQVVRTGGRIPLALPEALLGDGDYVLRLQSRDTAGTLQVIHSQTFTIAHQ
jgi:hypothetical protein